MAILALAFVMGGCSYNPDPSMMRRDRGLELLQLPAGGRLKLETTLERRTVVLLHYNTSESHPFGVPVDLAHAGAYCASATLISSDGYALTAAHCLHPDLLLTAHYLDPDRNYTARQAAAVRVVWKGEEGFYTFKDLALIKLEVDRCDYFRWASDPVDRTHDLFAATGACLISNGFVTATAGVIINRSLGTAEIERHAITRMELDGPLGRGDSGGPITDVHGNLLAIYTSYDWYYGPRLDLSWELPSVRHFALRPDPAWVQSLIDADRAAHATSP